MTSTSGRGWTSAAGRTGTGGGTRGGLKVKGLFLAQALGLLARLSWHVPEPALRREYLRRVWRLPRSAATRACSGSTSPSVPSIIMGTRWPGEWRKGSPQWSTPSEIDLPSIVVHLAAYHRKRSVCVTKSDFWPCRSQLLDPVNGLARFPADVADAQLAVSGGQSSWARQGLWRP